MNARFHINDNLLLTIIVFLTMTTIREKKKKTVNTTIKPFNMASKNCYAICHSYFNLNICKWEIKLSFHTVVLKWHFVVFDALKIAAFHPFNASFHLFSTSISVHWMKQLESNISTRIYFNERLARQVYPLSHTVHWHQVVIEKRITRVELPWIIMTLWI